VSGWLELVDRDVIETSLHTTCLAERSFTVIVAPARADVHRCPCLCPAAPVAWLALLSFDRVAVGLKTLLAGPEVRLLVVFVLLTGLSAFELPVDLPGVGMPPLAHPVGGVCPGIRRDAVPG
jgi:hypothetical protein